MCFNQVLVSFDCPDLIRGTTRNLTQIEPGEIMAEMRLCVSCKAQDNTNVPSRKSAITFDTLD